MFKIILQTVRHRLRGSTLVKIFEKYLRNMKSKKIVKIMQKMVEKLYYARRNFKRRIEESLRETEKFRRNFPLFKKLVKKYYTDSRINFV